MVSNPNCEVVCVGIAVYVSIVMLVRIVLYGGIVVYVCILLGFGLSSSSWCVQ